MIAIIGDIHGAASQLKRLVTKLKKEFPDIELYAVGDLIDRGPASKQVIDHCIEHNIHSIMGNHEEWIRRLLQGEDLNTISKYLGNPAWGIRPTLESYLGTKTVASCWNYPVPLLRAFRDSIPSAHKEYLLSLPLYYLLEEHQVLVTHSGLSSLPMVGDLETSLKALASASPESFYFTFPLLEDRCFADLGDYVQVIGHTSTAPPIFSNRFIAIDTGCSTCFMQILTALILPPFYTRDELQYPEDLDEYRF